jgi:hypothetical protein
VRYDSQMRVIAAAVLVVMLAPAGAAAAEPSALSKARAFYNAGRYDAAIDSARAAVRDRNSADAAALVLARAHIERYRLGADPLDLTTARDTLGMIRAGALSPRDQVDLLIGLGQTLYLGGTFGAAAEVFDTALARGSTLTAGERRLLLDWWATALEREAQTRPADKRAPLFARMAERMEAEVRADPGNSAGNYWLVVAVRGDGDLDRAWDTAVAAWTRARLAPETADELRADLDRLVTEAVIPERARSRPSREQQEAAAAFGAEWEGVKQAWK